jgi:hypothetical protein
MTTPAYSEAAGAADALAVWPPASHNRLYPILPGQIQQLMVALQPLKQQSLAGWLPAVPAGGLFWADGAAVQGLLTAGLAILAPPGATLQPEPPYTVHGVPGLGEGTTNSSP